MKKFEYMVFDIDTVNEPEDIFLNTLDLFADNFD